MLEEVLVREHSPEPAPGGVGVLELVRIEDPMQDEGDAGQQQAGQGEQQEDGSGSGRVGRSLVAFVSHLAEARSRQVISTRTVAHEPGYTRRVIQPGRGEALPPTSSTAAVASPFWPA